MTLSAHCTRVVATAILCASLAAALLVAGSAQAQVFAPHAYNGTFPAGSFTGAGSVGGTAPFDSSVRGVDVDQSTGNVYVGAESGLLYKFDASGAPQPFSALAPSTVISGVATNPYGETMVDNSNTSSQGRIFQWEEQHAVRGFLPSGEEMTPANGFAKFPLTETGDNCGGDVAPNGNLWIAFYSDGIQEYDLEGNKSTAGPAGGFIPASASCTVAIDSQGYIYTVKYLESDVLKWSPSGELIGTVDKVQGLGFGEAASMAVDRSNDHLFVNYKTFIREYDSEGVLIGTFGLPDASKSYPGLHNSEGVAVNENTHVVYAPSYVGSNPGRIDTFVPTNPITIPDAITGTAEVDTTEATLRGTVDPDSANGGSEIVSCEFQWGSNPKSLTNTVPCDQPTPITSNTAVTATIGGLTTGATYFYRVTAKNSDQALVARGKPVSFQPAGPPIITDASVSDVHSDSAKLAATIDPHGGKTTYEIEYGPTDSYGTTVPVPEGKLANNLGEQTFNQTITGLEAGTVYHYRVVATNTNTTTKGADHSFTTFPFTAIIEDRCDNAHVRQQVSAALLADCRAYELVSAADTGGYDVESDLVAGQEPFGGYPNADDTVLYGIHSGAIPGPWIPTNRGVDPYIATRGDNGWTTTYAGIPADNPFAASPFSSELDEASSDLGKLAFGGPGICSPCFSDGSTGIPLRENDGSLVQGMAGPEDAGPGAESDGLIRKRFSADGTHLVFGSTSQFAPGGNDETGDVSIYDRDLATGQTQVVSTDDNGDGLMCLQGVGQCHSPGGTAGIAELDVSADGSRIVVGQLVSTDTAGNQFFHLYMHIGSDPESIDLTPGTTTGALYDGMTEDGSAVYFTTKDPLDTAEDQDTDSSSDIFRADISPGGATLSRVSVGEGTGDTDSCDPAQNTTNQHWNAIEGGTADCGVVAIGGGGGVAAQAGSIYFLSPEQLDGASNGVPNAPNLYVEEPGSAPHFVVTLESILTAADPPVQYHPYDHSFGSAPNPDFIAVDASGGPSDGDIYVADNGSHFVRKYDPSGGLITGWGDNGALGPFGSVSGLAVDDEGKLYVGRPSALSEYAQDGSFDSVHGVEGEIRPYGIGVDDDGNVFYISFGAQAIRYDSSGWTEISGLTEGEFGEPIPKRGLAVDPNSGDLYLDIEGESIARFSFDASGDVIQSGAGAPCDRRCFPTSSFGAADISGASGLAVDPSNGDVYVDEGNKILRFNAGGRRAPGPDTGLGVLSSSSSIAVGGDTSVYANTKVSGGANIAAFAPLTIAPEPRVDNPAIIHGVNDAGTRHTDDFQVAPSGDAAFSAGIPITGYDNDGHSEIFRYDLGGDQISCASCNPTGARALGGASMAFDGLSLTDDGRVFFDSTEALAPRDLNQRKDVYEWEGSDPRLISTGSSPFDSSLLGASSDGKDVFFFTRDKLVSQDQNGTLAKVYDAREEGGFAFLRAPVPCKASDECHGAGTVDPGPPPIGTITGSGGNPEPDKKKCRKGFKRRGKHCVKKHRRKPQHRKGGRSKR